MGFAEMLLVGKAFVRTVFVVSLYDLATASIISSHVITESWIILTKYLPFLQLYVAGFQT